MVRSPPKASDTTTPVRPPTGPATSTPRSTSARVTISAVGSSPRRPTKRASAPSAAAQADVRGLPAGPAARDRDVVVAGHERLLEADDHVEEQVAERSHPHHRMVAWTR